jgi:hypothetical protein
LSRIIIIDCSSSRSLRHSKSLIIFCNSISSCFTDTVPVVAPAGTVYCL